MKRWMLWLGIPLTAVAAFVALAIYVLSVTSDHGALISVSSDDIKIIDPLLLFDDEWGFAEMEGRIRNHSDHHLRYMTIRIDLYPDYNDSSMPFPGIQLGGPPESTPPAVSSIDGATVKWVHRGEGIPPGATEHFRIRDRNTTMVPPESWRWHFDIIDALAIR